MRKWRRQLASRKLAIKVLALFVAICSFFFTCSTSTVVEADKFNDAVHVKEGSDDAQSSAFHTRKVQINVPEPKGVYYFGELTRKVLMINGTAEDSFFAVFRPEEKKKLKDYRISHRSSDPSILSSSTDVELQFIENSRSVNISATFDFDRFPGMVNYTIEFRRGLDNSLYDYLQVEFLAAGLAIFARDRSGGRVLLTGGERQLRIEDYTQILLQQRYEFGAFVQFLNGSNSDSFSSLSKANSFGIDDLTISFLRYRGQINWDQDVCNVGGGIWDGSSMGLPNGCGMAFSMGHTNGSRYDGLHFGLDFQKYRSGRLEILFTWEPFTQATDFEDELFMTFLKISVGGNPPPVVHLISPNVLFDQRGGQQLHVEMFNSQAARLHSFLVEGANNPFQVKEGSYKVHDGPIDFYETVTFITTPGIGQNLTWSINATQMTSGREQAITFQDATDPKYLFSYLSGTLQLDYLTRTVVSEQGGELVDAVGSFPGFNPAKGDGILFGNLQIDQSYITSYSKDRIRFAVPPMSQVGKSYSYDVQVEISQSVSNGVLLTYSSAAAQVKFEAFGSSYDDSSDSHIVGTCGTSTFIALLEGWHPHNFTYSWRILNGQSENVLPGSNPTNFEIRNETLRVSHKLFTSFTDEYRIIVDLTNEFIKASYTAKVKKVNQSVIGVSLFAPKCRTLAYPEVNLRVIANLEMPPCYQNATKLMYEWTYERSMAEPDSAEENITRIILTSDLKATVRNSDLVSEQYLFSYQNNTGTVLNRITPTRLGRELVIPQRDLRGGQNKVTLKVYAENNSAISGTAQRITTIEKSPLIALIGSGESVRSISKSLPYSMSASGSMDPDVDFVASKEDLKYKWSCFYYFQNNSLAPNSTVCDQDLLPKNSETAKEFTVDALNISNLGSDPTVKDLPLNIVYTMEVSKDTRAASVQQHLLVNDADMLQVTPFSGIKLQNAHGDLVDLNGVRSWEPLVIKPLKNANSDVSWKFQLLSPEVERNTFLRSSNKLITGNGYYKPSILSGSQQQFQQLPLGIKAGELRQHEKYNFSITFQEQGRLENEVFLNIRTKETPALVFPALLNSEGGTNTTFHGFASTTFDSKEGYLYYFYLVDRSSGREYCVDGCTGSHRVSFSIARPGNYTFQARLIDASGMTLLAEKNNSRTIIIQSNDDPLQNIERDQAEMELAFLRGDDGMYTQRAFYLTESLAEEDAKTRPVASNDENVTQYVNNWIDRTSAILKNSAPNTQSARSYISLAAAYAKLKRVENEETLYQLISLVSDSIGRTPDDESLDTRRDKMFSSKMLETSMTSELMRFYNFTITHAISKLSTGASRSRLRPPDGSVNNLLLDLVDLLMRQVTVVVSKDQVCGYEQSLNLNVPDGEPDSSLVQEGSTPPLGVSQLKVAVKCNSDQGMNLQGMSSNFSWCPEVYDVTAVSERKLFTLGETFDYVYLSGIQGENRTESTRLVHINVTTLGSGNRLVSALPESEVIPLAEDNKCYRVEMQMDESVQPQQAEECSSIDAYTLYPTKTFGTQYSMPYENEAYMRRTAGINSSASPDESSVSATTNHLGLYGASSTDCTPNQVITIPGLSNILGSGTSLAGMLVGVLLFVLIVTGLTYILFSTIFAAATKEEPTALEEGRQPYVERDYFGRGDQRGASALGTGTRTEPGVSEVERMESADSNDDDVSQPQTLNLSDSNLITRVDSMTQAGDLAESSGAGIDVEPQDTGQQSNHVTFAE